MVFNAVWSNQSIDSAEADFTAGVQGVVRDYGGTAAMLLLYRQSLGITHQTGPETAPQQVRREGRACYFHEGRLFVVRGASPVPPEGLR